MHLRPSNFPSPTHGPICTGIISNTTTGVRLRSPEKNSEMRLNRYTCGATRFYLRPSVIKTLGLKKVGQVISRTTNGDRTRNVYEPVQLELMGRVGNFDVVDVDETVPNRLGQIPQIGRASCRERV